MKTIKISIILPNGKKIQSNEYAETNFAAISSAYAKYCHLQDDRRKYKAKGSNIINNNSKTIKTR